MKKKTLTHKFLKALIGHKLNEVKEDVYRYGFQTLVVNPKQIFALLLIEDQVDIFVDEQGFIIRAITSDIEQTV